MDATIAAAWIGAGVGGGVALLGVVGTVVTSVVSSNNTRKANERMVEAGAASTQATLAAAHDAWLREKRAAVYEETLMEFQHRQDTHTSATMGDWDQDAEQKIEFIPGYLDSQGWPGLRARLTAYASDEVLDAFQSSNTADLYLQGAYEDMVKAWRKIDTARESGNQDERPSSGSITENNIHMNRAAGAAQAERDRLIKIIRAELRSMPEAALKPLAGLPAVHRRFRLRHRS